MGCLRVQRNESDISTEDWVSCSEWLTFAHPTDVYSSKTGNYLANTAQEKLLNCPSLRQYRVLLNAAWIRMEFQAKDQYKGQIRVYILPDDVGRGKVDRQQAIARRAMQSLLASLDISPATWKGRWPDDTPVKHVDKFLDEEEDDRASLFYIFNTLPSPRPKPEIVEDLYYRDAMYNILDSDVAGLITKMHPYQRRTAAMMLQREVQPSLILDPRLRTIIDQHGDTWYCDLTSSKSFREPRIYETPRGGICAETMGLGKTLICLALILATKDVPSQIPVEYSCGNMPIRRKTGSLMDMAAATISRSGTPWKSRFAEEAAKGDEYERCLEVIKQNPGHYYLPAPAPRRETRNPITPTPRKVLLTTATIVVVPSNLVRQWELEIRKHTVGLKVFVVVDPRAKTPLPPAEQLAEYDIILFSKGRFDQEAADGSDSAGRRQTNTPNFCQCSYKGSTRIRDCTCLKEGDVYRSPLKDLHIKRIITDEGHTFGNASKNAKTEGVTVIDFLQLSARWIVSGTPTQGLYGAEVSSSSSESTSSAGSPPPDSLKSRILPLSDSYAMSPALRAQKIAFDKQERKDLDKLGNIATVYLKSRPWANTFQDGDTAEWSQHVMQPRHGSRCHGNMDCLRSTMEGMILRHRPEDVDKDVTLPPLYQTAIYLDGSIQDQLSLNMFSMMIVSNAVTSERKDADYLFHPRQRKALNSLVSNLRQASFHWSGFTLSDVASTINVARKFLEDGEITVTAEDEILLKEAIKYGEIVLNNRVKEETSQYHEMPMYVQNELPDEVRGAWALDGKSSNPTLMGVTTVLALQKHVASNLHNPENGLLQAGKSALQAARWAAMSEPSDRPVKKKVNEWGSKGRDDRAPTLAGGEAISSGSISGLRKVILKSTTSSRHDVVSSRANAVNGTKKGSSSKDKREPSSNGDGRGGDSVSKPKSILKRREKVNLAGTLDPLSPLAPTAILSTSSAKLSYLIDRILMHHEAEKILIFYEADNVAYYIAQALECFKVRHLIYAKSLKPAQKAQYVVAFNQSTDIRVLLMDISQAAFGLDMSSASRVYFVNPVFSPQVEAQAVKRAHRIGQDKPVYVETLVLKGSIEEVILERRNDITSEEHNRCKTILDDQKMYEWIRNVRFIPVEVEDVPGPEQMAKLETPHNLFTRLSTNVPISDAEILALNTGPALKIDGKGKEKEQSKVAFGTTRQEIPSRPHEMSNRGMPPIFVDINDGQSLSQIRDYAAFATASMLESTYQFDALDAGSIGSGQQLFRLRQSQGSAENLLDEVDEMERYELATYQAEDPRVDESWFA